ncbi:hypothetical protein Cni_G11157 [Canna indica]|uniref:Uncharacterized protein n=1 Tax=Canna indica TaxID=4628 RepID=A0AAQ3K845_9LILI|nr:hypothetical protein Cni_G11157 [Canna indica]
MPPSPSSRRSPVELRVESSHKRVHSFESRFPLKSKDDDLVLFNEMQSRERDNFLLHSSDDFDESISKLKYFSDFKLGVTVPTRGESSDLLNADGDKNDYDWLLTPPDTPLFPSLDDDEPQPVNVSRGRIRSQPISISRTTTHEMTPRTNRSSASPHRSSQSPRSSYSVSHSRSRPASAPRSSPPPVVRATTPSRRSSTPPTKPSPPAQRSLTPTLRRMSTGSSGQAFAGKRGPSPVKTNRGNSASPKLRGWQSNIPGFSTDAPPNLRTSLTDRSASRVQGLSPSSGNGRGSMPKTRRQSISPSSSKSAISSQNSDGDHFSSIVSKASSFDDDTESHVSIGISPNAARKYRDFTNGRAMGLSKKPSRSPSASSAPKRSFDLALRQMDHRKTPQNMFRPLLSSVPATTFYSGKTSVHRPMFSRNSSLTTSSNASSEHGTSLAPYLEDSDHEQSDLAGQWEKTKIHEFQEEVFVFDKLDEISEDTGHENNTAKYGSGFEIFDESMNNKVEPNLVYLTGQDGDATVDCQSSSVVDVPKIDSAGKMSVCSNCGKCFIIMSMDVNVCHECSSLHGLISLEEPETIQVASKEITPAEHERICLKCGNNFVVMDMEVDVCQECYAKDALMASEEPGTMQVVSQDVENDTLSHEIQSQLQMPVPYKRSEVMSSLHEQSREPGATDYSVDSGVYLSMDNREENLLKQEVFTPDELNTPDSSGNHESPRSQSTPSLKEKDNSEGTGIAVLLMNRSSSRKWPVMRGKAISATNILLADPSYGGDNINAMKRSFGRDGSSTSSSIDLGSSGQIEGRILHRLRSRKGEMDNVRGESQDDMNAMKHSLGRHGSSTSSSIDLGSSGQADGCILHYASSRKSEIENMRSESHTCAHSDSENFTATETPASSCITISLENGAVEEIALDAEKTDTPSGDSELTVLDLTSTEQPVKGVPENETSDSCKNNGEVFLHNSESSVHEIEAPSTMEDASFIGENFMTSSTGCQDDDSDVGTHSSPLEIWDSQIDTVSCQDAQIDCTLSQMPNCVDDFQEDCVSVSSDKDVLLSELESKIADDPSFEEPAKTDESPKKHLERRFTMEEATDTILFCRSIVHDLAYKAATIAVEKELARYESSHSTVAFVGSTVSNRKALQKASNKHAQTPRKVKPKKAETTDNMPFLELENNANNLEPASCNTEVSRTANSMKLPKSESKCSCTVM